MRSRWVRVAAVIAAAVLVAVLVIVVSSQDPPPTASQLLERAQAFVDDAETVEYHGVSRYSYDGEVDSQSHFAVEVDRAGEELHAVVTNEFDGEGATLELLMVDDLTYWREADDEDGLDQEQWNLEDEDAYLGIPTFEITGILADARRPRLLGGAPDRWTVRTVVDFDEVGDLPVLGTGVVDVVVSEDGRLHALRLNASDGYEDTALQVEFDRWNGDVDLDLEEPEADDVDETPDVDEDEIEDYDEAALFQPAAVPEGWVLDAASVLGEGDTTSGCEEEVSTSYVDDEDFANYLGVYQFPLTCLGGDLGEGDPIVAGPYPGVVIESDEGYSLVRILVGETVIEAETDLTLEELAIVLTELEPLDLDNQPPDTLEL